jgi:hypothetical protein
MPKWFVTFWPEKYNLDEQFKYFDLQNWSQQKKFGHKNRDAFSYFLNF